jgi:hypothetical protein
MKIATGDLLDRCFSDWRVTRAPEASVYFWFLAQSGRRSEASACLLDIARRPRVRHVDISLQFIAGEVE